MRWKSAFFELIPNAGRTQNAGGLHAYIDGRELTAVSDVYFNVVMNFDEGFFRLSGSLGF